ncbi:hypothetical protein [Streptomyces kronopolitis]
MTPRIRTPTHYAPCWPPPPPGTSAPARSTVVNNGPRLLAELADDTGDA